MDLFPVGGFVRLRSRARDKYVHADEDATSVSLRPLGTVTVLNAVAWQVHIRPVQGGNVLLLQGAAYGKYLAVAQVGDALVPTAGQQRGVRAVQRDYKSPHLEAPYMWTPDRVEAGQNYVRLHNCDQGNLRANGRHRYWNNLVTVDVGNGGNDTAMLQWRVEAIPSAPEPLSPPPPPQPPYKECCACGREGSTPLCRPCIRRLKATLIDAAKDRLITEEGQRHYYCLQCKEIFTGNQCEHSSKTIPIGSYKNQFVAWVTGEESWRPMFERIEAPNRGIKPYQLYSSEDFSRCKICKDVMASPDDLYGNRFAVCSMKCFVAWQVAGAKGEEVAIEKIIMASDFCTTSIGFCLTCATVIRTGGGKAHLGHDWLRLCKSDEQPRLTIPIDHPKRHAWRFIKKEGDARNQVLIRDDSSVRCKACLKRLAGTVDACSLKCSLDAAKLRFLPRATEKVGR